MKLRPRGDRATSAVPVSLAARFSAWAKESLVARAIAVAAGLVVLAVIGGSALARNGGGVPIAANAEPSVPLATVQTSGDAGGVAMIAPPVPAAPTIATPVATAIASTAGAKARATPDDPVDLNVATADDLRRLPGVGAKRAEAILTLRARLPGGRFKQIEDLLKVKGIGRAMLRRLHPLVRITAPSADAGGVPT